ncbi:MAG: ferrochelatase [Marinilabiliaceae bacterium]|nr:ferrochelatase [Marinilabiliaceae bacterium]
MKGILIINMGGPLSLDEMSLFLKNMFSDKMIIHLPYGLRQFVAYMISNKRYVSSWKKYQLIGGTPIIDHTNKVAISLEEVAALPVNVGYSYTHPYISEAMAKMKSDGITDIKVITLYPQDSFTTTCSVIDDVVKAANKLKGISYKYLGEYANHPTFLEYWVTLIKDHLSGYSIEEPFLLFTAHSIPMYALKKGDSYPQTVKKMAANIAKVLKMRFSVSFQSKVGPVKWVGPDTDEHLEELVVNGYRNIIIIPISFATECLETIYDLDLNLIDNYLADARLDHISRVKIPPAHPLFIKTLKQLIDESNN